MFALFQMWAGCLLRSHPFVERVGAGATPSMDVFLLLFLPTYGPLDLRSRNEDGHNWSTDTLCKVLNWGVR